MVIVALIGVSWAFMLGVMVGRGYNPDAKILEFTGRVLRGKQGPAVQEPPQAILRPEELNFSAALHNKPQHNSTAVAEPPVTQPPARQTNSTAAPAAAGTAVAAQTAKTTQAAQPPAQGTPPGAQPALFDFAYQVATFREAAQADKLRERLEGEGVRNSLEKNPTRDGKSVYYTVVVLRRGTAEDEKQLLAVLERLKLGQPLLRSKKPVSGGGKAR
jgi:cell division septation protein DedD